MLERIKKNKKGFTLAELLIVVAIIGVLVAISIPIFTRQLHKARVATDQANCRSHFAELQSAFLLDGADSTKVLTDASSFTLEDGETVKLTTGTVTVTVDEKNGYYMSYTDTEDGCGNVTFGSNQSSTTTNPATPAAGSSEGSSEGASEG